MSTTTTTTTIKARTGPVVRGGKIAHTENHESCTACFIAYDAAAIRRSDV